MLLCLVLFANLEEKPGGDTSIIKTTYLLLLFYRHEVRLEEQSRNAYIWLRGSPESLEVR